MSDEWQPYLEEAVERAIRPASVEILDGNLKPKQVSEKINRNQLIEISQRLLNLTYEYSAKDLPVAIDTYLAELPGGKDWL